MPNTSTVREAPKLGYVKQLDGLRAASICAVLIVHMANGKRLGKGGWIGVDVFFVLSGFLITVLLLEDGRGRRVGRPSLPRFYLRRAFRLMPAFFAFLGVALLFAAIFRSSDYGTWAHELFMGATYRMNFYALGHATVAGLGPTWTLCLEEQFYLVWPITLILLSAIVPRRAVMGVVAGGIATSFLISIVLYSHHVGAARLYLGPDTNAASLLLGCLVGLAFNGGYLHRLRGTSFARWFPASFLVLLGGWTLLVGNNTAAVFIGPTMVFCILAAAAVACLTMEQGSRAALATRGASDCMDREDLLFALPLERAGPEFGAEDRTWLSRQGRDRAYADVRHRKWLLLSNRTAISAPQEDFGSTRFNGGWDGGKWSAWKGTSGA